MLEIRTVNVTRYITPLKEGGSLPAIADADDGFTYVLKFRGAGQGIKALVAEFIGGEVARALGFKVPELVFAELDEAFGRTEPDEEIQDLLKASIGLNIALHYLSGSITFDPAVTQIDPLMASRIVWMDALLLNMDRTSRNANMLTWNKELWLIDHGAALYFHHNWANWKAGKENPFPLIKDHILLPVATELEQADLSSKTILTDQKLTEILQIIPDEWLDAYDPDMSPEQVRQIYFEVLSSRVKNSAIFLNQALHARTSFI